MFIMNAASDMNEYFKSVLVIEFRRKLQVLGVDEKPLQQQIEPRIEYGEFHHNSKYIVYLVTLPSVSIQT